MTAVSPNSDPKASNVSPMVRRNILTILRHRVEIKRQRTFQERLSDAITGFSGSMIFVLLHAVWFAAWILLNTGKFGIPPFDPFPYGLLTMIVSLEAIFLSTFVLISQNRMSKEAESRAELDLQINLLTERELTRALRMLVQIEDKLGIESGRDRELLEMENEVKPEEVLNEIQRLEEILSRRR